MDLRFIRIRLPRHICPSSLYLGLTGTSSDKDGPLFYRQYKLNTNFVEAPKKSWVRWGKTSMRGKMPMPIILISIMQ